VIARVLFIVLLAATAFVGGCGGSDSASTATAPSITTQPTSQSVTAGSSVSFSVVASGTATLSYQWRKGGTAISGATSATYSISSVATSDAGSYDVVVSNSEGSVTSSAATLTVTSSSSGTVPTITTQPASLSVTAGGSATFSVVATSSSSLSYQWRKDGSSISNATSSSYTIGSVASSDAGSYDVVVTNSTGSTTSSAATLTVTTSSSSSSLSSDVYTAAMTFYNTLSTSQQSTVQLSWALDSARKWSNLPAALVARNGVTWGSLSTAQKTAARALIATALSSAGNNLHIGMQAADDYLAANGGGTSSYGASYYYIAFIGTPSTSSFWMLQLTGHHLTYNIAFNGSYKSPTPLFLGIEPKGSFTQSSVTYDPMEAQRTAMSNLGASLTSYSSAKLSGTYSDILFGANGTGNIDGTCPRSYSSVTEHGLLYSSLSSTDQALVQTAIKAYVNTQATEYADDLLTTYLSDTSLASTYVAYSGSGTVTTNGNYFRIEGPRLWIEFSVQKGVIFSSDIHYHTIWRDKYGDYGGKCIS